MFGGDSLNQGQTASDDLSPSRLPNSVDSSRPSRAAAVAGRERVKLRVRKLKIRFVYTMFHFYFPFFFFFFVFFCNFDCEFR